MTNDNRRDRSTRNIQDVINLITAALVFVSPWALGFAADSRAAWTAWAAGVVIAAMAIAALLQFAEWEEWVALVVGVALAVSPWVLGFAMIHSAAIVCAVLGIVVVLSSISGIWTVHQQPSIPAKL